MPLQGGKAALPVLLNEHRYSGGWGGGHQRKVCVDLLRPAGEATELQAPHAQGGVHA